jgi:peptidoglycan-N-acetylglucosamine deacetylase
MSRSKLVAGLSIDLDNKWSYLKTHGDPAWQSYPTFLDVVIPRMLDFLEGAEIRATFFVVGADAAREESRDVLRAVADAGHEIGNHSYDHEPWLHLYSEDRLRDELGRAHEQIWETTGQRPAGFRGPGYSLSAATLRTLSALGYRYDASTLPTYIGPLARAYYFRKSKFSEAERQERAALFGSWRDGLRPNRPYRWGIEDGDLVEMPVTTMPLTRLPIHFSYLLYLSALSPALAGRYLRLALGLCRWRGMTPTIVLHPLEFLDPRGAEVEDLDFLPWTQIPYQAKLDQLNDYLDALRVRFDVGSILTQVEHTENGSPLTTRTPGLARSVSE